MTMVHVKQEGKTLMTFGWPNETDKRKVSGEPPPRQSQEMVLDPSEDGKVHLTIVTRYDR